MRAETWQETIPLVTVTLHFSAKSLWLQIFWWLRPGTGWACALLLPLKLGVASDLLWPINGEGKCCVPFLVEALRAHGCLTRHLICCFANRGNTCLEGAPSAWTPEW